MSEAAGVVSVSRRIEAPAERIFGVLADPNRHAELDGSDMLRGVASGGPINGVGDRFVMNMYFDRFGGPYLMDNHVVEYEPGRRLAWTPAPGDEKPAGKDAIGVPAGHRWSFELEPDGPDATVVTETYDCTAAPASVREAVADGAIWVDAMAATLERLEKICTSAPG